MELRTEQALVKEFQKLYIASTWDSFLFTEESLLDAAAEKKEEEEDERRETIFFVLYSPDDVLTNLNLFYMKNLLVEVSTMEVVGVLN